MGPGKWVLANQILRITLLWTSIPSKGEYKYVWLFHSLKGDHNYSTAQVQA